MRYLGIDYGGKRIGLAISDEEGKMAFPHGLILNRGARPAIKEITSLVRKEKIAKIIIGLPVGLSGQETAQTKSTRAFLKKLKHKIDLPVDGENEMLTTRMVEREGINKGHMDEAAAALILQSYLDRQNKK